MIAMKATAPTTEPTIVPVETRRFSLPETEGKDISLLLTLKNEKISDLGSEIREKLFTLVLMEQKWPPEPDY